VPLGAERKHRITVLNVRVIVVTLFEALAVILPFEKEEEEKLLHMTSWYIWGKVHVGYIIHFYENTIHRFLPANTQYYELVTC